MLISINPKAGRGTSDLRAGRLCDVLRQKGFAVEIHTDLARVSDRANLLFSQGELRALVGVGGDGTAAELVNRTQPGVPVTLLPAGTANLIAKNLKLPFNPDRAAKMIEFGATCSLDAGIADERLFLIVVSAGIDADIVNRVHQARMTRFKKGVKGGAHISYFSYLRPILSAMFHYRFPTIRLESFVNQPQSTVSQSTVSGNIVSGNISDNTSAETVSDGEEKSDLLISKSGEEKPALLISKTEADFRPEPVNDEYSSISTSSKQIITDDLTSISGKWAFVFNLPQYGWGVPLVPRCKGNDSLLDYCVFQNGKFFRQLFNMMLAMTASAHQFLPGTKIGQGKEFLLTSPEGNDIPYELDGDPGGILPVKIRMIPNRFTVLAPKKVVQKIERQRNKS